MIEMKRMCPKCSIVIEYKSPISYKKALKEDKPCRSCSATERANRPEQKKRLKEIASQVGDNNPFFGKKHTKESKDKIAKKISVLSKGKNNSMYGKSVYSIWVEKYGEDIANQKMIDFKLKQSKLNSGKLNNMYGKPSPNGSGNGWSGWYNGWFFRSLRELTYMVEVIERFNLNWESAETNKWKIQYVDYKGVKKNYFPDFIIEGKYMIEIKPKRLWNSDNVIRKREAAELFCKENGLTYKIRDIACISQEKILSLYNKGLIKFTDRYEKKFREYNTKG